MVTAVSSAYAVPPVPGASAAAGLAYQLRFDSLFVEGRALAFPCDAEGRVDLASLSDRARQNYLRARAVVGREYRSPAVQLAD